MPKALTRDSFIEKAREKFNGRYSYDKVDYVDYKTEVTITCPIHGDFMQRPSNHLKGHGCPQCAKNGVRPTLEAFRARFSDKMINLSEFEYKRATDAGKCICERCGNVWYTTPMSLMKGSGCPRCAKERRIKKRTSNLEEFLLKYEKLYGKRYDFGMSVYKNALTKMDVLCPLHGKFSMTPNDLLSGHGCPKCNASSLEQAVRNILMSYDIEFEEQKRFDWLKHVKPLALDFYIPSKNIAIECQGIQHFRPIEHFGGENEFASIVKRDEIKRKLCESYGLTLVYYTDKDFLLTEEFKRRTAYDEKSLIKLLNKNG